VEIRNFLGEKVRYFTLLLCRRLTSRTKTVRHVNMLTGVTVAESTAQKDELILEGNDIDMVSQSGAHSNVLFHAARVLTCRAQLHRSTVLAWSATRTSGDSSTGSTCRARVQSLRIKHPSLKTMSHVGL
jgi:hypothetical protein